MENVETINLPFFKLYFNSRKRIAIIGKIKLEEKIVYICNLHLDARLNIIQRIEQLAFVLNKLKEYNRHPIILGGDFNTIPFYMAFNSIPIRLHNQHKLIHEFLLTQGFASFTDYEGHTLKKALLGMKLDHIYASGLKIIACGIEKEVKLSDHKPVWAEVVVS